MVTRSSSNMHGVSMQETSGRRYIGLENRLEPSGCHGASQRAGVLARRCDRDASTPRAVVSSTCCVLLRSLIAHINVFLFASLRIPSRAFCLPATLEIRNP